MKLAIFAPSASGHQMILYVRHIAREAVRRNWQVRLVTTEATLKHHATLTVLGECKNVVGDPCMRDMSSPIAKSARSRLLLQQWQWYGAFAEAFRRLNSSDRPDEIYVVEFSYFDKIMAIRGSPFGDIPFSGILMSPWFHHGPMGIVSRRSSLDWLYERAYVRLLRLPTLRSLFTVDEALPEYIGQKHPQPGRKLRYVPEAGAVCGSCTRAEARARLGLEDGDFVILVYGSISPRKGVAHLVHAICDPNCCGRATLLLAGRVDPRLQTVLDGPEGRMLRDAGRVVRRDGLLDDEQEWEAFRASDVVWVGYTGHSGMSGNLVQAARVGLPVLACRDGLIGWMCRKYSLGELVDPSDSLQVTAAVNRLADDADLRAQYAASGTLIAARHSPGSFAATICDGIVAD
jgi:glycosyltransferase involved in cell wall biosynthesis